MLLHELISDRLVSRFNYVPWPARSPDLKSSDCCLWEYLKSEVFIAKPQNTAALKQSVRNLIVGIPQTM